MNEPKFEVYSVPMGMTKCYVVAQYYEHSHAFIAHMTAQSAKLTGCHSVTAPTVEALAKSPNVHKYRTLGAAKAVAKKANEP